MIATMFDLNQTAHLLEDEMRRIREENAKLELKRDILKKEIEERSG
jgi:hypothetical protein